MKEQRLVQDYLSDILDAMGKADTFVDGMDFDAFMEDDKTIFAVIRRCNHGKFKKQKAILAKSLS